MLSADGGAGTAAGGGAILVVVAGTSAAASQTSGNVGPILAFVGAILVAFVAAFTARDRQIRELRAEAERLDRQLEHDRAMLEVEAFRALADEAATLYETAFDGALGVWTLIEDDPPDFNALSQAVSVATVAHAGLTAMRRRLQLRVPENDDLVTSYAAIASSIHEMLNVMSDLKAIPVDRERHKEIAVMLPTEHFADFCRAARRRLSVDDASAQA